MDFREITEFFKDAFKYILVIVIVIIISLYVLTFSQVIGPSMEPTHYDGEVMLLSKLHYVFGDVKQNDIVAYQSEGVRHLIKRVIALPGDTIEYKDNYLYINNIKYEEMLYDNMLTSDFKLVKIPDNLYPTNETINNSDYGIVTDSQILMFINGKVYVTKLDNVDMNDYELYTIPDDYYFMMGDNRSNSDDSRQLGLVSKEDIEGKLIFGIWPLNTFGGI